MMLYQCKEIYFKEQIIRLNFKLSGLKPNQQSFGEKNRFEHEVNLKELTNLFLGSEVHSKLKSIFGRLVKASKADLQKEEVYRNVFEQKSELQNDWKETRNLFNFLMSHFYLLSEKDSTELLNTLSRLHEQSQLINPFADDQKVLSKQLEKLLRSENAQVIAEIQNTAWDKAQQLAKESGSKAFDEIYEKTFAFLLIQSANYSHELSSVLQRKPFYFASDKEQASFSLAQKLKEITKTFDSSQRGVYCFTLSMVMVSQMEALGSTAFIHLPTYFNRELLFLNDYSHAVVEAPISDLKYGLVMESQITLSSKPSSKFNLENFKKELNQLASKIKFAEPDSKNMGYLHSLAHYYHQLAEACEREAHKPKTKLIEKTKLFAQANHFYQVAIELDPHEAKNHSSYAMFLTKKNGAVAEGEQYKTELDLAIQHILKSISLGSLFYNDYKNLLSNLLRLANNKIFTEDVNGDMEKILTQVYLSPSFDRAIELRIRELTDLYGENPKLLKKNQANYQESSLYVLATALQLYILDINAKSGDYETDFIQGIVNKLDRVINFNSSRKTSAMEFLKKTKPEIHRVVEQIMSFVN